VNGLVASQTQGSTTDTWTLDPTQGRSMTATANGATTTDHYAGDGDKPSWTETSSSVVTRDTIGLDGQLAAIDISGTGTALTLTDLHGDVIATVNPAADTGAAATYAYTEFGSLETTSTDPGQYGYVGGQQRSSGTLGDTVIMGARVYNTQTGRFDETDPEPGGSANAYDYTNQNPISQVDVTGRRPSPSSWRYNKCVEILNKIITRKNIVSRRARQLRENVKGFQPGDAAYVGHVKAYVEAQQGLRNALYEWDECGCGGGTGLRLPSGVWRLATAAVYVGGTVSFVWAVFTFLAEWGWLAAFA
jgi:RHS repeat-associated protein